MKHEIEKKRNNNDIQKARHDIAEFEKMLLNVPGATIGDREDCPLTHSFINGQYVREIFIPKGMMVVGKIHKHGHPSFLLKGKVLVYTEQEGTQELTAPLSMISEPGTKRVVYAIEDTVWTTIHKTDKTDLIEIEEDVIAKDYNELIEDKVYEILLGEKEEE